MNSCVSFSTLEAAGNPLPLRKFDKDSNDLPVEALTERDAAIKQHFSTPEVQYIGSSSSCGCAFPHAMFQNGGWPEKWNTKTRQKTN